MTVQIPKGQLSDPDDIGTPLHVSKALLSFMVPVKYYDKLGKPHQEFVFVVGNTVYKDPNGEGWASKLKEMSSDLSAQIVAATNSQLLTACKRALADLGYTAKASAGGSDEVDIIADEVDRDVTSPTT